MRRNRSSAANADDRRAFDRDPNGCWSILLLACGVRHLVFLRDLELRAIPAKVGLADQARAAVGVGRAVFAGILDQLAVLDDHADAPGIRVVEGAGENESGLAAFQREAEVREVA